MHHSSREAEQFSVVMTVVHASARDKWPSLTAIHAAQRDGNSVVTSDEDGYKVDAYCSTIDRIDSGGETTVHPYLVLIAIGPSLSATKQTFGLSWVSATKTNKWIWR